MTLPRLLHRLRDQDHSHMEPPQQQQSHLGRDCGNRTPMQHCWSRWVPSLHSVILLHSTIWAQ